jgi:hypothetical protein
MEYRVIKIGSDQKKTAEVLFIQRSPIHQSRCGQFVITKHAVAELTVHVTSHAADQHWYDESYIT